MIYLTRRERFCAAHRLYKAEWSDKKNEEVFGKCSNPNWHGHEYVVYITVKGNINPETGYVINLKTLSKLIKNLVIEKTDHKNINLEVEFMKGKMASTENLAVSIWHQLQEPIREHNAELHRVRIVETENNYVDYYGD